MSALRLDSFRAAVVPAPSYDAADIDAAYQRGLDTGKALGRQASLDALTRSLADTAGALHAQTKAKEAAASQAMAEMRPVLHQLVELLAESSARQRIIAAIDTELAALASVRAEVLSIRCPADCLDQVRALTIGSSLENAVIEIGTEAGAEISMRGGQVIIAPAEMLSQIRAIIDDITERK